jgi:cytochrome c peroxidase
MIAALLALLLLAVTPALAQTLLDFTDDERRAIVRHGPWPMPWSGDASNRGSGNAGAIELGRRLFFDTGLSASGTVSCATCHDPQRGWSDERRVSRGLLDVVRNAPTVADTRWNRWFGWDGATDSLWSSSLRPLVDPREMGSTPATVAARLRATPELACLYRRAFDAPPGDDAERVFVDAGKALAAFQETIVSGATPFDDFRNALARDDRAAAAGYPIAAQRGLRIFLGAGACNLCHHGPRFTNGEFADIGIPFFVAPGMVDPGRHGGLQALRGSPYTRLGRFSAARDDEAALATATVERTHRNFGEFRVPSLRELARTAPYMHAGSHARLHDVVRHYSEIDLDRLHADGEQVLKPLRLRDDEIDDLVAFLESLSAATPPRARDVDAETCR